MARIPTLDHDFVPVNLGGNTWGWTSDASGAEAVLDAFVAGGGSFVDTADAYPQWVPGRSGGESEEMLGAWMAARGTRDTMLVATKVGARKERAGLAPDNIAAACDDSLRRLQTDRIDLYYAHRDDESQPIEEIAATFDSLVRAGKVRAIGISNFTPQRIRGWLGHCALEGLAAPVALQYEYSLVHRREFEQDIAPVARVQSLATFPYYSLASGFLTGKYRTRADLEGVARSKGAGGYLSPEGLAVLALLDELAAAHGVRPAGIALAWMLAKGVTAPIASATSPEQVADLLTSTRVALSADEVLALDTVSRPYA